jgi:hypothetical protein
MHGSLHSRLYMYAPYIYAQRLVALCSYALLLAHEADGPYASAGV